MKRVFTLLFLIVIFSSAPYTGAQSITDDISVDIIPLNPAPGAIVTLRANSYSMDLSQASLSWTYNNVSIGKGTGKTTVSIVAPASGATGVISVSASGSGSTASTSIVLRPGSVDVLWEAVDAYTPPFYKGKALLPVNGLIRYVAMPATSAPKTLTYTWSRNSSVLPDESGYNKSSLLIKHSEFNPVESVTVAISGGSYAGNSTINVRPITSPSIVAYQNREGFVDYTTGYSSVIPFTQSGMVLHFEPYYFSIARTLLSDLSYDLTIDGQSVSPSKPNEVGLSRPSRPGQSTINLAITTTAYSLQHAEKALTLNFN